MTNPQWFEGLTAREAVEEASHEIRNHQMNIISLSQLLQRMNTGEIDGNSFAPPLSPNEGLRQIQDSVKRIALVIDELLAHVREIDHD